MDFCEIKRVPWDEAEFGGTGGNTWDKVRNR